MASPFLSIVIPAHNEERRLPHALEQIFSFLQTQNYTAEVLVVENGSNDRTYEIALELAKQHVDLRVLKEIQPGKGKAVRRGMLEASGEYRFMCDADLSMPINELSKFLPAQTEQLDVAIASREAEGAVRYNEPEYRHRGGRLINFAIRLLILPGFQDTQCGFKCFRGAVAEDLFPYQTIFGWSFDIEILYIALKRGYHVSEVPIHWYFDPETKLRAVKDAFIMLRDIFLIHWNNLRGLYDPQD
ncbi:MAG: dolichyl-phosphate beta-glucosyltransferase [Anaerolineales bacterium]